jgi:hypothetical protein
MGTLTAVAIEEPGKKKLVRRLGPDDSQKTRRIVRWLFVALNAGLEFTFFSGFDSVNAVVRG